MLDPKLYVIATPLGHRDDLTLRARETLGRLSHLFAEDTREIRKLLDLHGIELSGKVLHSYASHNMKEATEKAIALIREGKEIGLVCDRGTPTVADPGALLVRSVREAGYGVIPIPGPSAVTALFSVGGFTSGRFIFAGFLPQVRKERGRLFELFKTMAWPICLYEAPQRIRETVGELKSNFPNGALLIGREMTKFFEQIEMVPLATLDPAGLVEKGEYTLFLDPGFQAEKTAADWVMELNLRLASEKEWAKRIAERFGLSASDVYNALQYKKRERL